MFRNYFIEWLFGANTILGGVKRLLITMVSLPLLVYLMIKFFLIAEKIKHKSNHNYGSVLNHLGFGKITIALICFLFLFIIIVILIISKIKLIILNRKKRVNKYGIMGLGRYYELSSEFNIYKKVFVILGIIFLFTGIYLLNNTIVINKNNIVVENLIPFLQREYSYDDIQKINISIKIPEKRYTVEYTVKYTIKTKDNKKVIINNGEIKKLLRVNEIIKAKNIPIEKDYKYLEVLVANIDSHLKEDYRSLFK